MNNIVERLKSRKVIEQEPNRHGGWDDVSYSDKDCIEAAATEKALAEYTKAMLAVFDATKNPGQPH